MCLTATRIAAASVTGFFRLGATASSGYDVAFSLALVGAGHLVGLSVGIAMLTGLIIAWAIAVAIFLFHHYFNNRYGYFRDEFDYMSCGDHLQWGYVDQPPLIPFLIRICRGLFGDSLRSVRLIPALAFIPVVC